MMQAADRHEAGGMGYRRLRAVVLGVVLAGILPGVSAADPTFERETDRTGSDYRFFEIPRPRPRLCQEACLHEDRCRAWTFVRPGILAPVASCWLKSDAPEPQRNVCCVSGAK